MNKINIHLRMKLCETNMAVIEFTVIYYTICLLLIPASADIATTLRTTKLGTFKGLIRDVNVFGQTMKVEKYLGIPYAEAPRFKKPVIITSYPSLTDASSYGDSCLQLALEAGGVRNPYLKESFSEDCLNLNIFRPNITDRGSNTLPVMIWFHGGSFVVGSGQSFVGDMLSAHGGVLVVTVNYRLNVWGFISTGDQIAPGNLGLWDQHVAIKWVHDNILYFGGNPNDVTIFGQSAGGSSVIFQSLFPGNKGFFQRGLAMSGSITCPWSLNEDPAPDTLRLGKLLGCGANSDSEMIVNCILTRSSEEIMTVLNRKENGFIKFPMAFIPVVDGAFVKENPWETFKGHSEESKQSLDFFASIDFMTGIVSNEGGMMASPCVGINDPENFAPSREHLETVIIPGITKLLYGSSVSAVISKMITAEYINWTSPKSIESIRESFLVMSSHYVFDTHVRLAADVHANVTAETKTFVYMTDAFPSQHLVLTPSWMSKPNHADDLTFLFGYDAKGFTAWTEPYSDRILAEKWELDVSKLLMTVFTNFAMTGDPNKPKPWHTEVIWPAYDTTFGQYLEISKKMTNSSVKRHFCAKANHFWNVLIPTVIGSNTCFKKDSADFYAPEKDTCGSPEKCKP